MPVRGTLWLFVSLNVFPALVVFCTMLPNARLAGVIVVSSTPVPDSGTDRVLLAFSLWRGNRGSWSVGNFHYFDQRLTTTTRFAAAAPASFNLADGDEPERVAGRRVTHDFFPLFGIAPLHGRLFTPDEDQPGRTNVVILSYRLWQRRFHGDRAIVGRSIRMNGEPYDVIGIMPPANSSLP